LSEWHFQLICDHFRDNLLEIKHNFQCRAFNEAEADMNTRELYSKFQFDAPWIEKKSIWNVDFESRWAQQKQNSSRLPLHVIVLPHSHNDPGWLQTFEGYFEQRTKHILDSAIKRLPYLKDMTFMWTEISYLAMWFEQASEESKNAFKALVHEGKIEITTGMKFQNSSSAF
jgi:bifunctional pyridoxal-dependent enzyme with beta-cystathionase and maltose regulon repressor activities